MSGCPPEKNTNNQHENALEQSLFTVQGLDKIMEQPFEMHAWTQILILAKLVGLSIVFAHKCHQYIVYCTMSLKHCKSHRLEDLYRIQVVKRKNIIC